MADVRLMHGDCLDLMREIPDGSVDAIVTDPPYGLAFMGKEWDGSTPSEEYWREALRVAKPGAHLLCFGGTRTFHRMACAIEDAGWEIRDCIMWVYGSGFPKSMDVGKQLSEWDGWGTCLKPAWEPIIVARKPLDGTVAHNVMTHGTGALNIDGCRVATEDTYHRPSGGLGVDRHAYGDYRKVVTDMPAKGRFPANLVHDGSDEVLALFPQTGKSSGGGMHVRGTDGHESTNTYGSYAGGVASQSVGLGDSGSAARFFYCAKASKSDRGEGNDHPTVKPTALMQWLVRLVCPVGGTVLDPFCGSGSTGVACVREGMAFVGIELDEGYFAIAQRRIDEAASTPRLAI